MFTLTWSTTGRETLTLDTALTKSTIYQNAFLNLLINPSSKLCFLQALLSRGRYASVRKGEILKSWWKYSSRNQEDENRRWHSQGPNTATRDLKWQGRYQPKQRKDKANQVTELTFVRSKERCIISSAVTVRSQTPGSRPISATYSSNGRLNNLPNIVPFRLARSTVNRAKNIDTLIPRPLCSFPRTP